jgi:hypothetical protein
MKNKAFLSLVLLAFVTASAVFAPRVFAQTPTLDKLKFGTNSGNNYYNVMPANNQISGAVVIPDTYNNKPVTNIAINVFLNCTAITGVTIPASVTTIGSGAFRNCTSLTSVTFGGSATALSQGGTNASFPGDLDTKYKAGGAGTYTRPAGGTVWTKQAPAVNTSLDGLWAAEDGTTIYINGNTAIYNYIGVNPLLADAVKKGYVKVGDQRFRNIKSTGNLTWSMEEAGIRYNTSNRNVATGVQWVNTTLTMSANGQTLSENGTVRFERERVFNNW